VPEAGNQPFSPGAYGFRMVPAEPGLTLPHLARVDGDAVPVRMSWHHATALHDGREVGPDRVRLSYRRGGSLVVRREPAEVEFHLPQAPTPAAMVHPLGTMPLSVLAHWRGDITLHGGAFLHPRGAWGVCGDREAGKSTMLALLGQQAVPIVADDLLAIDDREVLAGPSCVDLRADVASRFPTAESLGMVGNRVRYRLATEPAPARVPLCGIFLLEWSDSGRTEVVPLATPERIALLHAQQYSTLFEDPGAERIMGLVDLPMLRFRRSRDWGLAAETAEALFAAAEAH
jgi:hypothetical protein